MESKNIDDNRRKLDNEFVDTVLRLSERKLIYLGKSDNFERGFVRGFVFQSKGYIREKLVNYLQNFLQLGLISIVRQSTKNGRRIQKVWIYNLENDIKIIIQTKKVK